MIYEAVLPFGSLRRRFRRFCFGLKKKKNCLISGLGEIKTFLRAISKDYTIK